MCFLDPYNPAEESLTSTVVAVLWVFFPIRSTCSYSPFMYFFATSYTQRGQVAENSNVWGLFSEPGKKDHQLQPSQWTHTWDYTNWLNKANEFSQTENVIGTGSQLQKDNLEAMKTFLISFTHKMKNYSNVNFNKKLPFLLIPELTLLISKS